MKPVVETPRKTYAHALPFGATLLPDGRARFRFWAPDAAYVHLELGDSRFLPMVEEGDGWFSVEADCAAGTHYRYRLADQMLVPDPASRAQLEDVHGASLLVDPRAYSWRHRDWRGRPWEETVLYELHVGACGGFRGVIERLPQLAEIGITAIELMPINDFPGRRNWGYDGVLPYAPDAAYGTPDDLKALIDAAHGLGLMVFLDVVYNHFGPDGAYLHAYARRFFREDLHTPWGAAIDFRRPEVRDYFTQNALYWLMEYRFDGLRFDAVHAISERDWLDEMAATVRSTVEPGRHVHLVLENEGNIASHLEGGANVGFDAQWNDDGHNVLHHLLTGEHESYYANYVDAPTQKLARMLSEGFVYQGEPMPSHEGKLRGEASAHLPPTSFVLFLQNHDQIGNRALGERLSSLADPEALRAATALQLLCPQIPLLFMGEEWGSTQPFLFFTDFHDELADAVREGRRKEFAGFAAFGDAATREKIPDPNAAATFERSIVDPSEARRPANTAKLEETRRLLALRHELLVPRLAGARALGSAVVLGEGAVLAHWRLGDGARWSIAVNLGSQAAPIEPVIARTVFETRHGVAAAVEAGSLPPQSTVVFLMEAA